MIDVNHGLPEDIWSVITDFSVKYVGVIYKGMEFLPKKIAVISWQNLFLLFRWHIFAQG